MKRAGIFVHGVWAASSVLGVAGGLAACGGPEFAAPMDASSVFSGDDAGEDVYLPPIYVGTPTPDDGHLHGG